MKHLNPIKKSTSLMAAKKTTYDHMFKLLIVGESGVGKTCMLLRFADDLFEENFLSTIGVDFKVKEIDVEGQKVKLQIWDSAGQERFRNITSSYYRNCAGIIIVYDVTSEDSFTKVTDWIQEVRRYVPTVPLMIVGNKCDLEDKRAVPTARGEEVAQKEQLIFLETSAKTNANIGSAFEEISKKLIADAGTKTKTESPKQLQLKGDEPEKKKKSKC
jgi:small GTP-binding protein